MGRHILKEKMWQRNDHIDHAAATTKYAYSALVLDYIVLLYKTEKTLVQYPRFNIVVFCDLEQNCDKNTENICF